MQKIDYKQEFNQIYTASANEVVLVQVPEMYYLMIEGAGDPNTAPAAK
jgi:hypothetical protein